jgi:hypothetical protein
MLGRIAGEVEEFCIHEECTTLDCVRLMKAKLKQVEGELEELKIRMKYYPMPE